MHFGENQLSRSLIGLSPLPTTHPLSFQPKWVRSSTTSYRRFNLAMGRSLRFGSRTRHYTTRGGYALFGLAFATATPHGLTSRHATNSQAHSSKGTPSPAMTSHAPALTDCKRTVSGTISLPSRGTFHLSLTVLVRYRSPGSIQAYRVVPTDSQQISRARCYLGIHNDSCNVFVYGTLTLYDRPFQTTSTNTTISHCRPIRQNRQCKPHNPPYATPAGYHTHKVWPHPLSLATTHGITIVFSSCGY